MEILDQTDFSLKKVEYLVFDEADILFEMGFSDQITRILKSVSQRRQTLLFSATIPKKLTDFASAGLSDYRLLRIDTEYMMPEKALLHFIICRSIEKRALLAMILQRYVIGKTIVFCPTRQVAEFIANLLPLLQIKTCCVYGTLDQRARKELLDKFKQEKDVVMVVTDLAARGLDIPDVKNVINYGFPQNRKMFIHRCGRTARAGRSGTAWNLFDLTEKNYLAEVAANLDRELVNELDSEAAEARDVTGNKLFDPKKAYYGRVGHGALSEFVEIIKDAIEDREDLEKFNDAAMNSMKKFRRTREKTDVKAKKKLLELDFDKYHPMFDIEDQENFDMLARVANYKPGKSYMELKKIKSGAKKNDKTLELIKAMKKKELKVYLNKKRKEKEIQEDEIEMKQQKAYEAERQWQQVQIEEAQDSMSQKYKSKLFISNYANEELQQKFFKKEGMTLDDLESQVMEKDNEQLFEHRKYIWDKQKRKMKKLRVNMQGKVIKDDDKNKIIGDGLKVRFKRWKKFTGVGIQKEGEQESEAMTKKARGLLIKRTRNRQTKHAIMAKSDGMFKMKKKKKLKQERRPQRKKKAGGGNRNRQMFS
jgi:ATP-dependent RNA helicase DDX54/DBP10